MPWRRLQDVLKTNKCLLGLFDLINEQRHIGKIYLYAKDLSESKYEYLIKNRETAGIKHLNDSKAFTECSNTMNDVYENIDDYNPNREKY